MTNPTVADYMIRDVKSVGPHMTVKEVAEKITKSDFHGFPITDRGYLLGFITAKELLRHMDRTDAEMKDIMRQGTITAMPSMSMDDATRLLFRYGLRNLPVVDENKKLVGIISNIDVVRSQIEKARPSKVMSVKTFLERQNNVRMRVTYKEIPIDMVIPTQKEVFRDELVGRQYEIKRGLNEPLIVIARRHGYLIVDGHHRVLAAKMMGMTSFKATVLEPSDMDVKFGLEKTAERWNLKSLDDVNIIEESKHPLMKAATMVLAEDEILKLTKRLQGGS
jgi:CBS domain-containing protein